MKKDKIETAGASFYEFYQNNSGGRLHVDDKLCHRLYIEARSKADAIAKAVELGCYWDGVEQGRDCSCCGDRWSNLFVEPINLKELSGECGESFTTIEGYAQFIVNKWGNGRPDSRLFYLSGEVKEIYKQDKK